MDSYHGLLVICIVQPEQRIHLTTANDIVSQQQAVRSIVFQYNNMAASRPMRLQASSLLQLLVSPPANITSLGQT